MKEVTKETTKLIFLIMLLLAVFKALGLINVSWLVFMYPVAFLVGIGVVLSLIVIIKTIIK